MQAVDNTLNKPQQIAAQFAIDSSPSVLPKGLPLEGLSSEVVGSYVKMRLEDQDTPYFSETPQPKEPGQKSEFVNKEASELMAVTDEYNVQSFRDVLAQSGLCDEPACVAGPINSKKELNGSSREKRIKKLSINRLYAACKRKVKDLTKVRDTSLARYQMQQLSELLRGGLLKLQVSKFTLNEDSDDITQLSESLPKAEPVLEERLWEPIDTTFATFANHAVNDKESPCTSVQSGDASPRTPPPNKKAKEALRKRLEMAPLRKDAIEIPEFIYNSDDEILS